MVFKILSVLLLISTVQISAAADYVLKVGEDSYEISLDEDIRIQIGGEHLTVKLVQKEILTYKTDNFSFEYPKKYSPSKSDLGSDIFQTAMMTPLGSLVIVQEYLTLDPSSLIDLMVNELTKEEREYGYKIESNKTTVTLADGNVLNGKVVSSKYKGSDIKRFIYTYGAKDSGLLIVTQVDYEAEPSGKDLMAKVINSLKITMK